LKNNKIYLSSLLSIKNRQKLSKLYEVILSNLTENNNTFVLNQLELIDELGQYLYDQTEFKAFYKQALPKLFDKFYLQNQKINETIIQMFNNSITNRILNFEDYYPHIENIGLEEDDDYKILVLKFFYNQMINNGDIKYDKMPKNIIDIIGNMQKEENIDIVKIASKIMNHIKAHLNQNDDDNNENNENNENNREDDNKNEINNEINNDLNNDINNDLNNDNNNNNINTQLNDNALQDIELNMNNYMKKESNIEEKNDDNFFNNEDNNNDKLNTKENILNLNNNISYDDKNDINDINEINNNNENANNPIIMNENIEENNNINGNNNNINNEVNNDNRGNVEEEEGI
jgi:hypothetical protein